MRLLIIGAGGRLSEDVTLLFGKQGFEITLVARTESRLKEEAAILHKSGIKAEYKVCDIGNENNFFTLLSEVKQNLPEIIILNAVRWGNGSIDSETWDSIKRQMDVNVGACFNLLKVLLPEYKKAGKGKLFFTGGGFSIDPLPEFLGMGMTKAALRNLVQSVSGLVSGTDIHIATLTISGYIGNNNPKYATNLIAEQLWNLYKQQKGEYSIEVIY